MQSNAPNGQWTVKMKETEKLVRVAIYARYSCDKQKETSLEDQIRMCRETAHRHGWQVDDCNIYTDSAISASKEESFAKLVGYQRFLKDWEAGKFDVFIVDEFSRMSRDAVQQAIIMRRLEKNQRVRMITVGGIDTKESDWQMRLGLDGVIAQQESRKTQRRVGRGMVGQLERGYMVATPPFGYELKREFDSQDTRIGTRWVVNETKATIVRQIFARREAGQSMHQIAAWVNCEGVTCTRKMRKPDDEYFWRPARIKTLLANTIYKGVFVWHGSTTYSARALSKGLEVKTTAYLRPELRLVSDETWMRCNSKSVSRSGYGGGKHALAGLIGCGHCGGTLVLTAKQRCRSVYCANCTVAKSANAALDGQTGTVAVAGVKLLLTQALKYFVTPDFLTAFRNSLRLRLTGDNQIELGACKARLAKLQAARQRLSHMLVDVTEEDSVLMQRYEETRKKVDIEQKRLDTLEASHVAVDAKTVEAQLLADPAKLLDGIFESDIAPERLRALLTRLFPTIVFEGKNGRYLSIFRIGFVPGAALAMASDTEAMMCESLECRFELKYWSISGRGGNQPFWTVTAKPYLSASDSAACSVAQKMAGTTESVVEDDHAHCAQTAVNTPGGRRVMTAGKIEEAKKLPASGMPVRDVAQALGVSMPSIYRWIPNRCLPSVLFSPYAKASAEEVTGCE